MENGKSKGFFEKRPSGGSAAALLCIALVFSLLVSSCGLPSKKQLRLERKGRRELIGDLKEAGRAGRPEWVKGISLPVEINDDYRKMRSEVDRRFGQSQYREAVRILYELIDNGEGHPQSWARYYIAESLIWAKEIPFAILEYESRGNEPNALTHLASCYLFYDQYSQSRSLLKKALRHAGESDTPRGLIVARANWMLGEVYRKREGYRRARKHYQRAAEAFAAESESREHADWYRAQQERARSAMEDMVELCRGKGRLPRRISDGIYQGASPGYVGDITVKVVVENARIRGVEVIDQKESIPLDALQEVPERIKRRQSLSVDGVSGATYTSRGIIGAVVRGLAAGPVK
jgi:uncharacterized protein with FMN-binding domain